MRILYFEKKRNELYYREFLNSLKRKCDVVLNKPTGTIVDAVVYGYGWVCDENLTTAMSAPVEDHLATTKVLILNKEYKNLEAKLEFVRKNSIDLVFTPHHDYKKWEKETDATFHKLPFAANPSVFKDWGVDKKYDLGFTGNLFNSPVYKSGIMGPEFNNVRERIAEELSSEVYKDVSMYLNGNSYVHGDDYGRLINSSKIWLCTPSAIQLVGTRFYDIMGSCSLLFCKESDVYGGLIEPGKHCVTFKDDLSDFSDKLFYYLENDEERKKIIKNANEHFMKSHTWDSRVDSFLEEISKKIS